ncbi:tripartite motif-containing protein 3-like [Lingula anatina]|uniref:Tripartite motif-containing protein 3-like n=1 Tax=Lingula anatina TaxID=7574 RepID=A0A1S3H1S4_LINAN|nr:tripartite motif-containing protein 3-like [Lingula anatina]|eukprot:XP_013380075.1 tripartite motif-containing protein 3-like [Lingula anatina]
MAAEAGLVTAFKDTILTCSICLEEYDDPRVLPCYHTFCFLCLSDHAQRTGGVKRSFLCPLCREEYKFPEEGLDKFKKNFVLGKALELLKSQGQGEPQNDMAQVSDTSSSDVARAALKDVAEQSLVTCEKHPPNELKYYCEDDDMVVCADCSATEHYRHGIIPLRDKAVANKERIKQVLTRALQKMNQCEEATQLAAANTSYRDADAAITAIKHQMQLLFNVIRRQGEKLITDVTKAHSQRMKNNETLQDVLELHHVTLQSACNFAQQLVLSGSDSDIMTHTESLVERLETLERVPLPNPSEDSPDPLYFIPGNISGDGLDGMLGRLSFQADYSLPTDSAAAVLPPGDSTISESREATPTVEAPLDFLEPAKFVHSLSVKFKDDRSDVKVTGMALDNEHMYFLDAGNNKIKLYTHFWEFEYVINLNEEPEDLVVSENGDMYVTSLAEKCISVYTPRGFPKMPPFGRDRLEAPHGITMNREGELMVCDAIKKAIFIFDPDDGDLLNVIKIGMCKEPRSIAFGRQYSTIVVCDYGSYRIHILSSVGHTLYTYGTYGCGDGQLYEPRGVCTDKYGYTFVADWANNRVAMITPRGDHARYIATEDDGITKPYALGMTKSGEIMIGEGGYRIRGFRYLKKTGKRVSSAKSQR